MRVPFRDVEKLDSTHLMNECLRVRRHCKPRRSTVDSSCKSSTSEADAPHYELYIPSPRDINRDAAFAFHLSTRNFFAYAVGRPVVGERLSVALEGLWQRLRSWAPKAATSSKLIAYLDAQGYSNFAANPEHALACLKFAEIAKIREVWINAFVHCAGMHEQLFLSPEFAGVSNTTNALITRASLEMDLHIARVVRAVSTFLEEELGTEHLGLSKPARDHLDYFRSFLHSYYVDKLGYFPPRETTPWDKRPWTAMYHDFQYLYDYLVDAESTCDMASAKALTGGICVIQNLQAFDQRHGYNSLPHPLPLLPQQPSPQRRKSQKGLRTLALVSGMHSVPERTRTVGQSLAMATNCLNDDVMSCQLVQEYQRFERLKSATKLDPPEARKIRWILIYSVLQMLASIMKAPPEVKEAETSYPLCALVKGCPPWVANEKVRAAEITELRPTTAMLVPDALDALEGRTSRISIHPDCEAENAEDFFASISSLRMDSNPQPSIVPVSRRLSTQLARTASIRTSVQSSVQALHRSVVGSLSRRSSLRRENPQLAVRKTQSHCEIVVEHYDDDDNLVRHQIDSPTIESPIVESYEQEVPTVDTSALQEFDFGLEGATGEPVLESQQLGLDDYRHLAKTGTRTAWSDDSDVNPRDSYLSSGSGYPTSSNRSSLFKDFDGPDTDPSSCDNNSPATESDSSTPTTPVDTLKRWDFAISSAPVRYRKPYQRQMKVMSVNVGCYVPSGMVAQFEPIAAMKSAHRRVQSDQQSLKSVASSFYPEVSVQAADIAEVEHRGRKLVTFRSEAIAHEI